MSVKNPNFACKNRRVARASKARKDRRQTEEAKRNKIDPKDVRLGARPGLLPNSGPNAKLSSKKARKLEKKMRYALQRKMEREGEVVMGGKCLCQSFLLDKPANAIPRCSRD